MTNLEFYLKCKEEGVTSSKTDTGKARIHLVAENNGIIADEKECVKMFKLGKDELHKKEELEQEQARKAAINEQSKEETELISETIKISGLFGKDKPIYYCQKRINELRMSLNQLENKRIQHERNTESFRRAVTEKEQDWAVHGGIASGIAGGAAGVATALEIQQKNAQIRAHNKEMSDLVTAASMYKYINLSEERSSLEDDLKWWKNRLNDYKKRLIKALPEIDLLENLNPIIVERKTTITGALKMKVQINPVKLLIYDKVNATIDGSFKALFISKDDTVINEVYFNLPDDGATKFGKGTINLTGYSLKNQQKDAECKIVFIPINLWAIETNLSNDYAINYSSEKNSLKNRKEIAALWKKDIPVIQKNMTDVLNSEKKKLNKPILLKLVGGTCSLVMVVLFLLLSEEFKRDLPVIFGMSLLSAGFLAIGCTVRIFKELQIKVNMIKSSKEKMNKYIEKKNSEIESILN